MKKLSFALRRSPLDKAAKTQRLFLYRKFLCALASLRETYLFRISPVSHQYLTGTDGVPSVCRHYVFPVPPEYLTRTSGVPSQYLPGTLLGSNSTVLVLYQYSHPVWEIASQRLIDFFPMQERSNCTFCTYCTDNTA